MDLESGADARGALYQNFSGQLNDFQRRKVEEHLPRVKWVVFRLMERLPPHIESEDLFHSGILGLVDAARRFPWGRINEDQEFKTYAEFRVRGQIMDDLRRLDILPRSAREKVNRFKHCLDSLRSELKREPTDRELCGRMKVGVDTLHRFRSEAGIGKEISLETDLAAGGNILGNFHGGPSRMGDPQSPEALFHLGEVKRILADEIARLTEREREVIGFYYYKEMTLKEIGNLYRVTESRVSQIHARAVRKLLRRLRQTFGSRLPVIISEVTL